MRFKEKYIFEYLAIFLYGMEVVYVSQKNYKNALLCIGGIILCSVINMVILSSSHKIEEK